jgi:hypothetical protein
MYSEIEHAELSCHRVVYRAAVVHIISSLIRFLSIVNLRAVKYLLKSHPAYEIGKCYQVRVAERFEIR